MVRGRVAEHVLGACWGYAPAERKNRDHQARVRERDADLDHSLAQGRRAPQLGGVTLPVEGQTFGAWL